MSDLYLAKEVVRAWRLTADPEDLTVAPQWVRDHVLSYHRQLKLYVVSYRRDRHPMSVPPGDWLLLPASGTVRSMKNSAFDRKYEQAQGDS